MKQIDTLLSRYPDLTPISSAIKRAYQLWKASYEQGKKTLVCGNGGSAADSEHIVGELMKGFEKKRAVPEQIRRDLIKVAGNHGEYLANHLQGALPAVSLTSQAGLITAYANDVAPDMIFAQQVFGYGKPGDVLIGLSTSGNSKNVINAVQVGKALGMITIGFTGKDGGQLAVICDETIIASGATTAHIQERHLAIYHTLCLMLEEAFFS